MKITNNHLPDQFDVIIIGSGVSGLAAVKSLVKKYPDGISILIVEASGAPGGRIASGNLSSHTVDTGAAWIHGGITTQENPVLSLLTSATPKFFVPKQDNFFLSKLNPWTMAPPISTLFCTQGNGTICMSTFQSLWDEVMNDLASLALHVTVHHSPERAGSASMFPGDKGNTLTDNPSSPFMSAGALLCALLGHEKYSALSCHEIELLIWRFWNYGCWQADTLYRIPSNEFECAPPRLQLSDLYGQISDAALNRYVFQELSGDEGEKGISTEKDAMEVTEKYKHNDKTHEDDEDEAGTTDPEHFMVGDYSGFHGLPHPAPVCLPVGQRSVTRYRCSFRKQRVFHCGRYTVYSDIAEVATATTKHRKNNQSLSASRFYHSTRGKTWVLTLQRSIKLVTQWKNGVAAMPQVILSLLRDCGVSPYPRLAADKPMRTRVYLALNCKVRAVNRTDPDRIRIFCQMTERPKGRNNGKETNVVFAAKHVICTIPAPVLASQMKNTIDVVYNQDNKPVWFSPIPHTSELNTRPSQCREVPNGPTTSPLSPSLSLFRAGLFTGHSTLGAPTLRSTRQSFFYPELPPEKLDALEKISMGKYKKVFLLYDHQWWPDTWSTFIPISDPISHLGDNDSDNDNDVGIGTGVRHEWECIMKTKTKFPKFHLIENYAKMKNTTQSPLHCLVGILVGDEVYSYDVYTPPCDAPSAGHKVYPDPNLVLKQALCPYASLFKASNMNPSTGTNARSARCTATNDIPSAAQYRSVLDSAPELVREASVLQSRYDTCQNTLTRANHAFERLDIVELYENMHPRRSQIFGEQWEGMRGEAGFVVHKRLWSDEECVQGMKHALQRICSPEAQGIHLKYDCSCLPRETRTTVDAQDKQDLHTIHAVANADGRHDDGNDNINNSDDDNGEDRRHKYECSHCTTHATHLHSSFPHGFTPPEPIATLCTGWERNEYVGYGAYPHGDPSLGEDDILALQEPILLPTEGTCPWKNKGSFASEKGAAMNGWDGVSLHFAGDCTEGMHMGSVHGAYLSGIRAAEEICTLYD